MVKNYARPFSEDNDPKNSLQSILNIAKIGSWKWMIETGELYWTEEIAPLFGFDRPITELNYEDFITAVHPEDRQTVSDAIRDCIEKNQIYDVDHRVVWPDGTLRWMHERGNVIRDDANRPIYMLGMVYDITEDRSIREKLEMSTQENRFFREALDSHSIVAITDHRGKITYVNHNFTTISGYREDELLGNTHKIVNSGYHPPSFFAEMWKTISKGKTWNGIIRNKKKNGDYYWVETSIVPQMDSVIQTPSRYISIRTDITKEIVSAQERIDALREKQKYKEALLRSQKMEAIGQLAGGIAHDFNNILTSIVGFTNLCRRSLPLTTPNQSFDFLNKILTSSERAVKLIRQMLDFSRQNNVKFSKVRISDITSEIIDMMSATIPSTVEIIVENRCQDQVTIGNPTQIHQILMNLVINARDAIKGRGKIWIQIDPIRIDDGNPDTCHSCGVNFSGDFIRITICDNGPGIQEQKLHKIFEPFYTEKPPGKGTGMGLAVVHGITHNHNGHIRVSENGERKACFAVYLPCSEIQLANVISKAKDARDGKVPAHAHSDSPPHLNVVVIDDEIYLTKFVTEYLKFENISCTPFNVSTEAMEYISNPNNHFDIILSDLTMPSLTGEELLERYRTSGGKKPFIIWTGRATEEEAERLIKKGADSYLLKPVKPEDLLNEIKVLTCTKSNIHH